MRFSVLILLPLASLLAADEPGWKPLFDGRSLEGWMWSTQANPPQPSWAVENGLLRTIPDVGERVYLLTRESFTDYELEFEWKAETGANSGIKYRFQGYWNGEPGRGTLGAVPEGPGRIEPVALEYQIADDLGNRDARSEDKHSTAALYEYWPAAKAGPASPGVWHTGRIVARDLHIEHWLDGRKVVDVDLDSPEMQQAFASSRRRGSAPLLARHQRRSSPIALQFHDGSVWFRNLRIRRLQ
jgi:hypothetical protein